MQNDAVKAVINSLHELCVKNANIPSQRTVFHSVRIPPMSVSDYAKRIHKYSHCSEECFVIAAVIMDRYCKVTQHHLTFFNLHRLLITAVLLAAKSRDDVYYSNAYYSSIGGVGKAEINALEIVLLGALDWSLWVEPSDYFRFVEKCESGEHLDEYYAAMPAIDGDAAT